MIKPGFKAILAQEDRDVVDAMDFFSCKLKHSVSLGNKSIGYVSSSRAKV